MPFKRTGKYALHLGLFLLTLLTTTIAGAEWRFSKLFFFSAEGFHPTGWFTRKELLQGLLFSIPFLGALTVHEFGHYFTARRYRIRVSLPYFIPFYFFVTNSIGTMGAFIKIKERIFSRKEYFDVGIAGPLAGLVIAIPVLFYGYTHLPTAEFIYSIHPEYRTMGFDYAEQMALQTPGQTYLGKNLMILFFEHFVAPEGSFLPPFYETIHYPFLMAGYLSLFFTALNLLPIGQLDGGHVLYGLLGYDRFNRLAPFFFTAFILYGGLGILSPDINLQEDYLWVLLYLGYLFVVFRRVVPTVKQTFFLAGAVAITQFAITLMFPGANGYAGWLAFGLILSRFVGIFHPPAAQEAPLSKGRKILGWITVGLFILCFSPEPFVITR